LYNIQNTDRKLNRYIIRIGATEQQGVYYTQQKRWKMMQVYYTERNTTGILYGNISRETELVYYTGQSK
jgi:hypothetical protein